MKDYSSHSDDNLMKEIKVGNMLAFDELYGRYSRRLYKFAFSILKTSADAENIVQDVFLNLWLNRDNIEKDSSVRYYIFTIAHNSSISAIRKKLKETEFLEHVKNLQYPAVDPVDLQLEYKELDDKLNEIINSLPDRQKEVYLLHREKGLKYSQIATRLHISVNTVENHMVRALKVIREQLGNYTLLTILFCHLFI